MPNYLLDYDQNTGLRSSDWPRILIAFLNSVWSGVGGFIKLGSSFRPVGAHTSNAALSGVVTLTPPAGATMLMLQTTSQNIRVRLDGGSPSSTIGFQIKAGDPPTIVDTSGLSSVTAIEEAASATIQYQWGQ